MRSTLLVSLHHVLVVPTLEAELVVLVLRLVGVPGSTCRGSLTITTNYGTLINYGTVNNAKETELPPVLEMSPKNFTLGSFNFWKCH